MQDRFKFRVWEKDQKIMKECTQITLDKDQTGSMCDIKGKVTAHLVYQPHYILMQCTGLKDKNGKLIYEGDIVEVTNCRGANAVVRFNTELVKFELKGERFSPSALQLIRKDYFEIIGNIYENPELLEG